MGLPAAVLGTESYAPCSPTFGTMVVKLNDMAVEPRKFVVGRPVLLPMTRSLR